MRLANGSRVVIVGGGPAGSFMALHLLHFAAQASLHLDLTIFEARDFNRPGPASCNKCAGILSSTLVNNLTSLGIDFPAEIIQSKIDSYVLHLGGSELMIHRPDPGRRIISVYRGGGPRLGAPPFPYSLDAWLLNQAQARGAVLHRGRVTRIRAGPFPTVITHREEFDADLVVMATGINTRAPLDAAWGYRPPRTEVMAQDEIPLPESLSDGQVHIYFEPPVGLIFGGVIPKGRYANVSLLGHKLPPTAIAEFLEGHQIFSLLPDGALPLCGCRPQVVVSEATGYYADRLVAVGDAAVTRLYKDGLGAAFITSQAAARTAIELGIGRRDFARGYHPVCRGIALDNVYGRLLFRLAGFTRRSPALASAWHRAILQESGLPPDSQPLHRLLWGMFTGDESYQQVFRLLFRGPFLRLGWDALRAGRRR
jgi:flavin-dependent dehydrogenase